jgi:hypothetical protein
VIDFLFTVLHWCASCAPAGNGVSAGVGAFGAGAGAAGGMGGMGGLAGDGGIGDTSGAPGAPSSGDASATAPGGSASGASGSGSGSGSGASGSGGPGTESPESSQPSAPDPAAPDDLGPAASVQMGYTAGPYSEAGPGWIDNAFDLNPNTSFIQAGMDGLGFGPTGSWGRYPNPDEGDLTTLGRALGTAAAAIPAAGAVAGGHLLDDLQHGPEEAAAGAGLSNDLNNGPPPRPTPPPEPQDPPEDAPQDEPPAEGDGR